MLKSGTLLSLSLEALSSRLDSDVEAVEPCSCDSLGMLRRHSRSDVIHTSRRAGLLAAL